MSYSHGENINNFGTRGVLKQRQLARSDLAKRAVDLDGFIVAIDEVKKGILGNTTLPKHRGVDSCPDDASIL